MATPAVAVTSDPEGYSRAARFFNPYGKRIEDATSPDGAQAAQKQVLKPVDDAKVLDVAGRFRHRPIGMWRCESEVATMQVLRGRGLVVAGGGAPFRLTVERVRRAPTEGVRRSCKARLAQCFTSCCSSALSADPYAPEKDLFKYRALHQLSGHTRAVTDIKTSCDEAESLMYSASADGQCIVWDTVSFQKKLTLGRHDPRRGGGPRREALLCVAPMRGDAASVCTSSEDQRIRLWDVRANKCVTKLSDTTPALKMVAGAENELFTGDADGAIQRWDARTGKQVGRLVSHSANISDLAYDRRFASLYSASFDGTIKRWSASTGRPELTFLGHRGIIRAIEVDEHHVYSCSMNSTVRVWCNATGENISTILLGSWPNVIRFYDESALILAMEGKSVALFPAHTHEAVPAVRKEQPLSSPQFLAQTNLASQTAVLAKGTAPGDSQGRYLYQAATEPDLVNIELTVTNSLLHVEPEGVRRPKSLLKKMSVKALSHVASFQHVSTLGPSSDVVLESVYDDASPKLPAVGQSVKFNNETEVYPCGYVRLSARLHTGAGVSFLFRIFFVFFDVCLMCSLQQKPEGGDATGGQRCCPQAAGCGGAGGHAAIQGVSPAGCVDGVEAVQRET